jgi:hypothetical protein
MGVFEMLLDILHKKTKLKGLGSNSKKIIPIKRTKKKRDNFHESRLAMKKRRKKYFSSASRTPEEEEWMNEYLNNIRKKEKLKVEENIAKGEMWLGMSREQLTSMMGQPVKKTETISRSKKIEIFYYDDYEDDYGKIFFRLKVILISGMVEKWTIH